MVTDVPPEPLTTAVRVVGLDELAATDVALTGGKSVALAAATSAGLPALALTLAAAVLARPLLEFVVKAVIDRPRPDLNPLISGVGASHPSGHVLAAMTLWGLLPPIAATLTNRRVWWWISAAVGAVLVVGIAASRVYLGVHWFSDVVQGILIGFVYLVGIEMLFLWHHRRRPCGLAARYLDPGDGGLVTADDPGRIGPSQGTSGSPTSGVST